MYLQPALTVVGVVAIAYKAAAISISYIFPLIRILLPNRFRRKRDKVRKYRVILRPRQDMELRQCFHPSAPADSSNP